MSILTCEHHPQCYLFSMSRQKKQPFILRETHYFTIIFHCYFGMFYRNDNLNFSHIGHNVLLGGLLLCLEFILAVSIFFGEPL